MANFFGFLLVAIVVIVTPGPDTALTIKNTLLGGRRGGVFTAVGVAAGQMTWALATSAGIATLLAASEPIFRALRLAGAAYLMLLGLLTLREALHARRAPPRATGAARAGARAGVVTAPAAARQGLISNLTNPKMALFFPALLPQFAGRGDGAFFSLLLLGMLFTSMTLAWLAAYAFAVAKVGDILLGSRVRRMLEAVSGAVLIGMGLRLATEQP